MLRRCLSVMCVIENFNDFFDDRCELTIDAIPNIRAFY